MDCWLDNQVSLYSSHSDNVGQPATYRDILLCSFAKDLPAITALRKLDRSASDYRTAKVKLKSTLQCYTPAALLKSKATGSVKVVRRTGMLQLDFDYDSIKDYDIEELKEAVFALPWVGFCGLSCSGDGFYALVLIDEPEKLQEYAEHLFIVLVELEIYPDTSKGKKVENLRYLSYDKNMMIRENPVPLKIIRFRTKSVPKKTTVSTFHSFNITGSNSYLKKGIAELQTVQVGQRWPIVQKVAYTLGGYGNHDYLDAINQAINSSPAFAGEEEKYLRCAKDQFAFGAAAPFKKHIK
jgi:hypothetical protein